MNHQAGTLWTWVVTTLLHITRICEAELLKSSIGGDCINLLLLRDCLRKIQITLYHHPPRFLLVPPKLSVKPGDKLHLRNVMWLSKYLLPFCSLPEVGKKGCGKLCARRTRSRRKAGRRLLWHHLCWGFAFKTPSSFQVVIKTPRPGFRCLRPGRSPALGPL